MKVIHFDNADSYEPEENWRRVSLCNESRVSVEHFVKPPRHASPPHSHPHEQVVVVIKGEMVVKTEGGPAVVLKVGDAAYFPANEIHTVINNLDEPSIGIDIFTPGRSFDFWLKRK